MECWGYPAGVLLVRVWLGCRRVIKQDLQAETAVTQMWRKKASQTQAFSAHPAHPLVTAEGRDSTAVREYGLCRQTDWVLGKLLTISVSVSVFVK